MSNMQLQNSINEEMKREAEEKNRPALMGRGNHEED